MKNEQILARLGEIALKGLNRGKFEQRLMANLKRRLNKIGDFKVKQSQSRIWIVPENEFADCDLALKTVTEVFGLVSASKVRAYPATLEALLPAAKDYMLSLIHISEPTRPY